MQVIDVTNANVERLSAQKEAKSMLELAPPIHAKFENCLAVGGGALSVGDRVWPCEFCSWINRVELVPEEIAELTKGEMVDFLVTPPEEKKQQEGTIKIFAIDVSGSMCVTYEVEGKVNLKVKAPAATYGGHY
jgi:hypothetical protein